MNRGWLTRVTRTGVLAGAALGPLPALGCAACYGASDSPLAQGMNWGILTLLGVVAAVLGLVFAFFVHVGRSAAKLRAAPPAQSPSLPPP